VIDRVIDVQERRRLAAVEAASRVGRGQRVGLGTGRTAALVVEALGTRAKTESLGLTCVATSVKTEELARAAGLAVEAPDRFDALDIAIDGADEVDPALDLVKGLGGALLRERLVERLAKRLVIVVDDEKLVARLGRGKIPVEIVPFGASRTMKDLAALGSVPVLRADAGKTFVTDGGNWIADLTVAGGLADAGAFAGAVKRLAGVVDHGLFLGMATEVVVGKADGSVETKRR
jgi:ribose 5-phosphate isomerase A